jgi:hypothetical protein
VAFHDAALSLRSDGYAQACCEDASRGLFPAQASIERVFSCFSGLGFPAWVFRPGFSGPGFPARVFRSAASLRTGGFLQFNAV